MPAPEASQAFTKVANMFRQALRPRRRRRATWIAL